MTVFDSLAVATLGRFDSLDVFVVFVSRRSSEAIFPFDKVHMPSFKFCLNDMI